MLKRFVIFAGVGAGRGGWNDILQRTDDGGVISFDSLDEAKDYQRDLLGRYNLTSGRVWSHIVDLTDGSISVRMNHVG